MPTTPSEWSSKVQTMQSVFPGKGPWQGCALLPTHFCLLLKSAVHQELSAPTLIMLDYSVVSMGSNRVTNATANLSSWEGSKISSSQEGSNNCYCLAISKQHLLLLVKEKGPLLPSSPQRSNFPGQETSPGPWQRRVVLYGSHLLSSAIPFRMQYLKGEIKWVLAMMLILFGRF